METMRTVLVVDDQSINRKLLKRQLDGQYRLLEAANGREAIALLCQSDVEVSLILLDLVMPEMNGYDFLAWRQTQPPYASVPVLIITGDETTAAETHALELGANDFLSRLCQPDILRLRMENLIRMHEAVRDSRSFSALMNKVPCGIAVFEAGERLRIRSVNDAIRQLSGYTPEEYLQLYREEALNAIMPEDLPAVTAVLDHCLAANAPLDMEYRTRVHSGAVEWHRLQANYVDSEPCGKIYYGMISNIQQQKETEHLQQQQQRELLAANRQLELTMEYSSLDLAEYAFAQRELILHAHSLLFPALPAGRYPLETLLREHCPDLSVHTALEAYLESLRTHGEQQELLLPVPGAEGTRWFKLVAHTIFDADGQPVRALATIRDVSQEVQLRQDYEKERSLRMAQSEDAVLTLELDLESNQVLTRAALPAFGFSADCDVTELYREFVGRYLHPDDRALFDFVQDLPRLLSAVRAGKTDHYIECRCRSGRHAYTGYRWHGIHYTFICNPSDGHIHGFVDLRDIHERKSAELATLEKAQRDSMTGLLNRATFEEFVTRQLQSGNLQGVSAFLLIDIDDFKTLNDTLGHSVGDDVLRFMARRLQALFRSSDIIGRLGGDELAVFLTNLPDEQFAVEKGGALCRNMSSWRETGGKMQLTCSVGIALYPRHGKRFEQLYQNADAALYRSKENGKNQCTLFGAEVQKPNISSWMDKNALIDSFDERVYLADIATHELLYMNRAALAACKTERRSIAGKKCYEVVAGLHEPCPNCTANLLSYGEFYTWSHTDPRTGVTLLCKDKLINWNERPARIEIAMEMTENVQKSLGDDAEVRQARIDAERYRFLLEHTDLMPFEYDPLNDELLYICKDRAGRPDHRSRSGFVASLADNPHFAPDALPGYMENIRHVLHHQVSGTMALRIDLDDTGHYLPMLVEYTSLADEKGRVYHVSGKLQAINAADTAAGSKEKPVVLIADDAELNRGILRESFASDYTVLEASDGAEALRLLHARADISVLLLDLMMPGTDGFAVLQALRSDPGLRALVILVCTASGAVEDQLRALKMGAQDYISSPFNTELVRRRVDNILAQNRAREQSRRQLYDPLTGLYNREGLLQSIRRLLDENADTDFTVVSVNIRHFKLINELFGNVTGDNVLCGIADDLRRVHHPLYTCGRIESDNFYFCLPTERLEESVLTQASRRVLHKNDIAYSYSCNFGIYDIDDRHLPASTLCDRAKEAMDTTLHNYAVPFARYSASISRQLMQEQRRIGEIHRALKNGEFLLYYQPIYGLHSEQIVTVEALVRWQHPVEGLLSPGDFIPLLERTGLIAELDCYTLRTVCHELASRLAERRTAVPVSLNLSRMDFFKTTLARELTEIVDSCHVPHEYIRFEIAENAYADNASLLVRTVSALKQAGFSLVMDNFGTSVSSFSALRELPVDVLKIDLRALGGTGRTQRSDKILQALVRTAKWLDMLVVAEGVESRSQLEYLRSTGFDRAQGYYYARPLPVDKLLQLLDNKQLVQPDSYQALSHRLNFDYFWESVKEIDQLFGGLVGGMGLYELQNNHLDILRVNDGYFTVFGEGQRARFAGGPVPVAAFFASDEPVLVAACLRCRQSERVETLQRLRRRFDGGTIWVEIRIRYLGSALDRDAFCFSVRDITSERKGAPPTP